MSHIARMNESCHTYEWVMTHTDQDCGMPINSRRAHTHTHTHTHTHAGFIYEWVMSHIWMGMSRARMRMSHIWMSHVTYMLHTWIHHHMNESCHTYECVMSYIWIRHDINESCHTYECVITWMSHVTRMNASLHEWVMSHVWMRHVIRRLRCGMLTNSSW